MTGYRAASLGCVAGVALMVGVCAWTGFDAVTALGTARQTEALADAGARLTTVERDMARLLHQLESGDQRAVRQQLGALHASLSAALVAETAAGRVESHDLAMLAGLLNRLNTIATGTVSPASLGLETGQIEQRLAVVAGTLRALEREGDLRRSAATETASASMRLAAATGGLALLLGFVAFALKPQGSSGVDPGHLAAERAEMDRTVRLARARFVLMMSHELRTPLNGVLGLLSLMKESDPPEAMRPMIQQAERAGRRLAGMLHDMLEVESSDTTKPAAAVTADMTFQPADIAQAMDDLYGPLAYNGGPAFAASVKSPLPTTVQGDGVRFQRAVSHLCNHVMETAGVEDVALEVSHAGGECRAELSYAHKAGPEAALRLVEPAPESDATADTAGTGLGPLLARGLLEQMGGRLEIMTLDSGRVVVLAATPSRAIEDDVRPRVRIIAQTRSLDALGAAAAASAGVRILSAESEPAPDIVLLEAGDSEEAAMVSEVRGRWPSAHLISLGSAQTPAAFDSAIPPPLEPARVAATVAEAWEHCQHGREPVAQPRRALRVG